MGSKDVKGRKFQAVEGFSKCVRCWLLRCVVEGRRLLWKPRSSLVEDISDEKKLILAQKGEERKASMGSNKKYKCKSCA